MIKPTKNFFLNRNHLLTKGLVGCWILNEGCGDKIWNLANPTYNGNITSTSIISWKKNEPKGLCLNHNGGTAIVDLGTSLNISYPYTLVSSFKITNFGAYRTIFGKRDANTSSGMRLHLGFAISSGVPFVYDGTSVHTAGSGPAPTTNIWNQIAWVGKSTGVNNTSVFLNGKKTGTYTGNVSIGTKNNAVAAIGANGSVMGDPFLGQIGFVYLYNRALTGSEVMSLYINPYCMLYDSGYTIGRIPELIIPSTRRRILIT